MTDWVSRKVAVENAHDIDTLIVAFGENDDGSGRAILLMRSTVEATEEERDAGLDDYAIGTETGATVYGGIRGCRVTAGSLKLQLTEEAASELGMGSEVSLELRDATLDLPALRESLIQILRPDSGGPTVTVE